MKPLSNDIVLRPRFQLDLPEPKEAALEAFETHRKNPFTVKRMDDHVFIKFNAEQLHFWSPQLHLEINETDEKNSKLYGLFGPNPTLWTFFMFLHFGVATIFIVLGVWAYSSASLDRPYGLQVGLMVAMVVLWFALYAFGRAGRHKGKPQMRELYGFMMETLDK
ncbi:GTP-binding protein [Maribacter halichondriae]|uniref:GTP-binding protein n=1 Tax=Maribacter halichondriae TaxID=2980554 RepID=UPI0023596C17|nr:GTP-binding protein [Maribacter sp. Hal144]